MAKWKKRKWKKEKSRRTKRKEQREEWSERVEKGKTRQK